MSFIELLATPEVFKTEDNVTPVPVSLLVTEQNPRLQLESTDAHDTRNSPSIMSPRNLSDNEDNLTPAMAEQASALGNSKQEPWKACRDCNQRHRKCFHNERDTSSLSDRPASSRKEDKTGTRTGARDLNPQPDGDLIVAQQLENTEFDDLQQLKTSSSEQQTTVPETTREDSPELIDMALWTQRHRRSQSTDSDQSGTSIPYKWHDYSSSGADEQRPQSAGETIVVQPRQKSYAPQEIRIWEGSEELRSFPTNLYRQLSLACTEQQTNIPDCAKIKWPAPKSVYDTGSNKSAKFVDPATKEDLWMARYHYGKMHQLIVVKQKNGTSINGGEAVIINYTQDVPGQPNLQNPQFAVNTWKVWDPLGELSNPQYVIRIMETVRTDGKRKQISGFAASELTSTNATATHSSVQGTSTVTTSNKHIHDDDTLDALNLSHKKPRHSYGSAYDDSGNLWPKKGSKEYIVVKRASDGQLVKLACPHCSRHDFETVGGLGSHCRNQHGMQIGGNHEVVDACGIPTSEVSDHKLQRQDTRQKVREETRSSARKTSGPSTAQEAARGYVTPAPSSTLAAPEQGPMFVFKKSDVDLNPRVRSLKACNSAEKLFVNALVAGVARKDTLMLTVQIGDGEPMNIIRGDAEDYNTVVQAVEDAGSEDGLMITVTAEEIDV